MGCWGIKAFESDDGLDAIGEIRSQLTDSNKIELSNIIEYLKNHSNGRVYEIDEGRSHSGPMVLAELIIKYIEEDFTSLDYDDEYFKEDKKFKDITSFTATKESIQWITDYLSESLEYTRENASCEDGYGQKWGGWFKEEDWMGWQNHMEFLIDKLNEFAYIPEKAVDLALLQNRNHVNKIYEERGGKVMEQKLL